MDLLSQLPTNMDAKEEARSRADQELKGVEKTLKEAEKCLRRDWEQLAPRERSAQSRVVKELKQRKRLLEEEIEMNSGV